MAKIMSFPGSFFIRKSQLSFLSPFDPTLGALPDSERRSSCTESYNERHLGEDFSDGAAMESYLFG